MSNMAINTDTILPKNRGVEVTVLTTKVKSGYRKRYFKNVKLRKCLEKQNN